MSDERFYFNIGPLYRQRLYSTSLPMVKGLFIFPELGMCWRFEWYSFLTQILILVQQ